MFSVVVRSWWRSLARAFLSLCVRMRPTSLINVSPISASQGGFWRASNYRGTVIPGFRGTMRNIACAKIIFCEKESAGKAWAPEAIHIGLVPTSQEFPPLTELEEAQLAAKYQPQLLMFRLRNLSLMYQCDESSGQPALIEFAAGGSLPPCIAEDPEIRKALTPLLEAHEQDLQASRALNPDVASVEAVWAPSHKTKEMSTAAITKRVNALLHERGETLRYNSKEIGWKLRKLRLLSRHNGKRRALRFTRDVRRQIHRLAAQFGLQLPKVANCADCDDCKGTQLTEQE
jgi:hypothetical protein